MTADDKPSRYSSPACLLGEADPSYVDPKFDREELIAALNVLLEAERAGAKTLAHTLKHQAKPDAAPALAAIRDDEARYVALLTRAVEQLGGTPSHVTGNFFDKAAAIADPGERLAFLNRGQGWVVKRLNELLPRIADDALHAALTEMRDTHLANIARAETLTSAPDTPSDRSRHR